MKIQKILNNNVVIARDENDKEVIVMSKGLGFRKKQGDIFPRYNTQKIFVLSDEVKGQYDQLISSADPMAAELAEDIISYACKEKGLSLNDIIHLTLTDHIDGLLDRIKSNILFANQLTMEIRRAYRTEFSIGLYAIDLIEKRAGCKLPYDEAAFIALHFIDNRTDHATSSADLETVLKFITDITRTVEAHFGITLDEDSVSYYRFVTHLKYLTQRIISGNVFQDDPTLFDSVAAAYPESAKCVDKISTIITFKYHRSISTEERAYLIIYVEKLTRESK